MCHVVPMAGALITSFILRKKKDQKIWWLNLMFYGGALFGLIDHVWNKELFLVSEHLVKDLGLGIVISIGIVASWLVILAVSKTNPILSQYADVKVNKVRT